MKIISHRGSNKKPENTLQAFALSQKVGFCDIELDVHLSRDNILVVHHDYDLLRTAKRKVCIKNNTYDELRKYNIGQYFEDGKSYILPRLADVLDMLNNDIILHLEIKNDDMVYEKIEELVLNEIHNNFDINRVIISSFEHRTLKKIRKLDGKIKIAVPLRKFDMGIVQELSAVNVNISAERIERYMIEKIHMSNRKVCVYTVNNLSEAKRLKNLGVDGIFTDTDSLLTLNTNR